MLKLILTVLGFLVIFGGFAADQVCDSSNPHFYKRYALGFGVLLLVFNLILAKIDYSDSSTQEERLSRIDVNASDNLQAAKNSYEGIDELRRLLNEIKEDRRDEFDEKYPLGYALLYTDGKRRIYDDTSKSHLDVDWNTCKLVDSETDDLVITLGEIRWGNSSVTVTNFTFSDPDAGQAVILVATPETDLVLEVIESTDKGLAVVIGVKERQKDD